MLSRSMLYTTIMFRSHARRLVIAVVRHKLLLLTYPQEGSVTPDVTTPSSSTITQAIRLLYGQTITKDLLQASVSASDQSKTRSGDGVAQEDDDDEGSSSWDAEVHFTNANYQAKKMVLLLFINRKCH